MWSRRFFRIAQGQLQQVGGDEMVPLVTARVKPVIEADRRNCFVVIGPGCEVLLQGDAVGFALRATAHIVRSALA